MNSILDDAAKAAGTLADAIDALATHDRQRRGLVARLKSAQAAWDKAEAMLAERAKLGDGG